MTEEDKKDLRKRVIDRNSGEYPRDAVHLFAEKAGVYKQNKNIMNGIDGEKVDISRHDTVASAIPQKRQGNLLANFLMMLQ